MALILESSLAASARLANNASPPLHAHVGSYSYSHRHTHTHLSKQPNCGLAVILSRAFFCRLFRLGRWKKKAPLFSSYFSPRARSQFPSRRKKTKEDNVGVGGKRGNYSSSTPAHSSSEHRGREKEDEETQSLP